MIIIMPRAKTNGIELEYEIIGEGEPLVLIMGIGAQLIYWRDEFCQRLAGEGFTVVRFDNRDVGLSTKLDGHRAPGFSELVARGVLGLPIEAPYDLSDMADDTAGLLTWGPRSQNSVNSSFSARRVSTFIPRIS